MATDVDTISAAAGMICKAAVLAARWAGTGRRRALEKVAAPTTDDKDKEILLLREEVAHLRDQVAFLQKQLGKGTGKRRYSIRERLFVIFQMEYFGLPRRKVTEYFGVSRSTLYRWLQRIENAKPQAGSPPNKTPGEVAALVWEIAKANVDWGRVRIANQLKVLGVFLAASTVRNILNRPQPRSPTPAACSAPTDASDIAKSRSISAFYPNHVWSVDLLTVRRWGLWPTHVLVAIDHFSRKVMTVSALKRPSAACAVSALEQVFRAFGPPKHLVSDRQSLFIGETFANFLKDWTVKQRFGAVGKHGSVSVKERVIKTLKYEWLKRVPLIKGFVHLDRLCAQFVLWYGSWRPHMALDGFRPDDLYCRDLPEPVTHDAKIVPPNIERRLFKETRTTGYRPKQAA